MNWFIKSKSILTFVLAVFYIANIFLSVPLITRLNFILLVYLVITSFLQVRSTARLVAYFLFVVSFSLLIYYKAPLEVWVQGIGRNLYLIVMFTLAPLLAFPIRHGGYTKALKDMFKRYTRKDSDFYFGVSFMSFFLGVMVNIGALPLMYEICQSSEQRKNHKLLGTSICRGITSSIIWAPNYATTALVLELTRAKWSAIFPYGVLLGISAIIVGWLNIKFNERGLNNKLVIKSNEPQDKINWLQIFELFIFTMVLILGIVLISEFTGLATVIVVSMVALIFPICWLVYLGKPEIFITEFMDNYFPNNLPRLKNEIVLFTGAGLFSTAVVFSHLGDFIPAFLVGLTGNNILLLSSAVILITILLGLIGIHPIITITIIGSTVPPSMFDNSSAFLALTLTAAWSLATTLSPSSANVISMAGLVNHSLIEVGPKWNVKYVFTVAMVFIVILNILHAYNLL
ncbi:MAG: C4-dicarboxylate ABC transporter [Desulfitobacterium sp.]